MNSVYVFPTFDGLQGMQSIQIQFSKLSANNTIKFVIQSQTNLSADRF